MLAASSALLFALLAGTPSQDPAPPAPERHVNKTHTFALELPNGWRQLTPDEAFELGKKPGDLPADLLAPQMVAFYPYGAIDRWRAAKADEITRSKRPDLLEPGDA